MQPEDKYNWYRTNYWLSLQYDSDNYLKNEACYSQEEINGNANTRIQPLGSHTWRQ